MPPYEPVKSKAQSRALFALAKRGEVSEEDARGKTRAADFESLPERVRAGDDGRKPKRAPQGRAAAAKRQALRRAQRQGR